jgi:hypothetical protein
MAQAKKIAARSVVQGINVLGVLLGFGCCLAGVGMLLSIPGERAVSRWLVAGFSVFMLVAGVWLLQDSYRRFRRRSFEGIKSVAKNLAFGVLGLVAYSLNRFGDTLDLWIHARTLVNLTPLFAAWLVYSICTKLTNRVLKAASGPEEPSE